MNQWCCGELALFGWIQWCDAVLTCGVDEDGGEGDGAVGLMLREGGSRRAARQHSCPRWSCHVVDEELPG